jgi:zinc protease
VRATAPPSRPGASATAQAPRVAGPRTLIPVEQYRLANGLKVVLHVDRSDPVVAVSLNAHVGSSREVAGRTGFAHLFEHLFFLESENLGKGGLDRMTARIGGSGANGSTSRDITDYLQTVPKDALEKMIWAEADKIGFFINTVTEPVLAKEKQVVKNEKRQSVDNQPYGHTGAVARRAPLPGRAPVQLERDRLARRPRRGELDDVRQFYRRWYVPNNVALVIAGDFDPAQARQWVQKYFGEFPRGGPVPPLDPRPAALAGTKRLSTRTTSRGCRSSRWSGPPSPRCTRTATRWGSCSTSSPTARRRRSTPCWSTSSTSPTASPPRVPLEARRRELPERPRLRGGRPRPGGRGARDGFARFEKAGVDAAALERAKTAREVGFYDGIGSVLGKAARLARYDLYAGTADFADTDVARLRAVTAADVRRVYEAYIKGRPFVATSFVPKGKAELALEGSARAGVVEEAIVQGAEAAVDPSAEATYARTPSAFDRTREPPSGPRPDVVLPTVWSAQFANGLKAYGIRSEELPVASFELAIAGGRLLDDLAKPGAANLVARMLLRGTARRTPAALEDTLRSLGADVSIAARDEHLVVSGRVLARHFERTLDLLEEIVLEPRWDAEELALQKAAVVSQFQSEKVQATSLAARAFNVATFGEGHIYSRSPIGTPASVAALTMDDLKRFHAANLAPNVASFRVVGAVDQARVRAALQDLGTRWARRDVKMPAYGAPQRPSTSAVYFYDLPARSSPS